MALDAFHGVDTYASIPDPTLENSGQDNPSTGRYGYDPTPWNALPQLLHLASLPTQGFTFVDIGCGKGRIALSALGHPFARVIGVEFSPHLYRIAQNNFVPRGFCIENAPMRSSPALTQSTTRYRTNR